MVAAKWSDDDYNYPAVASRRDEFVAGVRHASTDNLAARSRMFYSQWDDHLNANNGDQDSITQDHVDSWWANAHKAYPGP